MGHEMITAPIVVGVDGSLVSFAALQWAVAEAAATGRQVRAVAVWSYVPALEPGGVVRSAGELAARHRHRLSEAIRRATQRFPGVTVTPELVEGEVVEALLTAATNASLLVLGSHGHGRLLAALLGSVSARCVHRASCPVVIMPARAVGRRGVAGEFATTTYAPGPLL
jgi:nucleotide-binding universal stress UspA family protein